MTDPNLALRVDSVELSGDFQLLSPAAPLPWAIHASRPFEIVDANGERIAAVHGKTYLDSLKTACMIVCAANTCGGISMEHN